MTIECDDSSKQHAVKTSYLQSMFGTTIEISPSEYQKESVRFLKRIYSTPDDRVNKMVYHLRPANLTMKINAIL